MRIIRGLKNLKKEHTPTVVTIGNFDGVHKGHQALLDLLFEKSEEFGARSTLVTFEPQPREFFAGALVPARLSRFREKISLLGQYDLDQLFCMPFNLKTSEIPASWFVEEFLPKRLGAKCVIIGDDFQFGHNREGNYDLLAQAGKSLGYDVQNISTVLRDQSRISSTQVRESLNSGNLDRASDLLGYQYFIMGRVVYGRQLGRQLGFPTANVKLKRYRAALSGVFCVRVDGLEDRSIPGVANIGIRPTVDGKEPLLEVHMIDYESDIYGKRIKVTFEHRIREEMAFESLDALKERIGEDLQIAKKWFEDA